jgi:PAS domain S-box-containing protein
MAMTSSALHRGAVDQYRPYSSPDVEHVRAAEEVLMQFETNWRTFATYTQDMLQRKLKELDRARGAQGLREIQDRLEHLAGTLGDLRSELSETTSEVRGLSREVRLRPGTDAVGAQEATPKAVTERGGEGTALQGACDARAGGEVLLRRVESDVEHAGDLFSGLVAAVGRRSEDDPSALATQGDRPGADLTALEREGREHLESLLEHVREARRRSAAIGEELRRARETEACLQLDLAEAASREEALRKDLEDSDSKRADSFIEEGMAVQRERDLTLELDLARERLRAAEERLAKADAAKAREEADLDARRAQEAEASRALEAARKRIEDLESEKEALESRRAEQALDLTAARDELSAVRAELEGLRAGRKERLHDLHEENRRLAAEVEASRSEASSSLAEARDRISELEGELARSTSELLERDTGISRIVAELTQTTGTLREREERITALEAELARLAHELRHEEGRVVALSGELGEVRDRLERAETELAAKAKALAEGDAGSRERKASETTGHSAELGPTEEIGRDALDADAGAAFSRGLLRSLPIALIVLDGKGRVVSWNRLAESLFGIAEETALGKDFFSLETPLAKPAFRSHYERNRADEATRRIRVRMEVQGIAGNYILTQAPFRGDDGGQRGAIFTLEPA